MTKTVKRRAAWLGTLLLATGAALWLARQPENAAVADDELRGSRLFAGDLETLRLQAAGADCNYRHGDIWRGGCGRRDAPVDGDMAGRLAMAARMRAEREFPAAPEDLAALGLAAPPLTLAARTATGPVTLRFGALAPDGLSRYAFWVERQLIVTTPDFHYRNLLVLLCHKSRINETM